MFRNQYDNDVTVWSPQGRLHQVEYAMEAVKQGSATVGVKSKSHAVLAALKRASSELAAHQKKVLPIDDHIAVSISGLTADARVLSRYMRLECLNERYAHDQPLALADLMERLGLKMQVATQRYDKRPYGVGLLVAGYDSTGPHIYQTCPSANYYECRCMAIGARSQSARTYLERHLEEFEGSSRDQLIRHALRALRDTLAGEGELTAQNCSLAIVGEGADLEVLDDAAVTPFLEGLDREDRRGRPVATVPEPSEPSAPEAGSGEQMDTE